MPYPASDIDYTAISTHDQRPGPRLPYDDIIDHAISDIIRSADFRSWNATKGSFGPMRLGREPTPVEIYNWVNTHKAQIIEDTTNPYHHDMYFNGKRNDFHTKNYINLLKNIVNGRKMVLDKYQHASTSATHHEIEALKQMLQLPNYVREWLKQQKLTDDEKRVFNLMQSADSSADAEATTTDASANAEATTTSADAGGRRRRKTSFRRRRMSRYRSSKSKSKKSRKSRKCVR
jgi:hypothetical protein